MGGVSIIQYNDTTFRALFPAFESTVTYPEVALQAYWNTASAYISDVNGGCYVGGLSLAQQTLALNQMTAHLVALNALILAGQQPSILTAAGIDKINVTIEPPPAKNMWQYWLQTTPYGQMLLALLQVAGVGGLYVPGALPAQAGFGFGGGFRGNGGSGLW